MSRVVSLPSLQAGTIPVPESSFSSLIGAILDKATRFPGDRPVLFVSVEPLAGVTWIASAVAAELAATGRKVLLADASVIASLGEGDDAVPLCKWVGPDKLWALGESQVKDRRLSTGSMPSTFFQLSSEFPYIVLDAPALARDNTALRLASGVNTILIVRRKMTVTREAVKAVQTISSNGGHIIGCVYNEY